MASPITPLKGYAGRVMRDLQRQLDVVVATTLDRAFPFRQGPAGEALAAGGGSTR